MLIQQDKSLGESEDNSFLVGLMMGEVPMTTESGRAVELRVDDRVSRTLAAVFGALFGVTLLTLIVVIVGFTVWVVRSKRERKYTTPISPGPPFPLPSLPLPSLLPSLFLPHSIRSPHILFFSKRGAATSVRSADEHMVQNCLYRAPILEEIAYKDLEIERKCTEPGLRGNRYEDVDARKASMTYDSVDVPKKNESTKPVVDGYSHLEVDSNDVSSPPHRENCLNFHTALRSSKHGETDTCSTNKDTH